MLNKFLHLEYRFAMLLYYRFKLGLPQSSCSIFR